MIPDYRKPLVVVAPKILLRHPKAASSLADLAPGTTFQEVIGDNTCDKRKVNKVTWMDFYSFNLLFSGYLRFWQALDRSWKGTGWEGSQGFRCHRPTGISLSIPGPGYKRSNRQLSER